MNDIQHLRNFLEQQKGKLILTKKTIKKTKKRINQNTKELYQQEQALIVVREVGLQTQSQLQFHISDITSLALEAIFNDPYKLEAEFVERRNKTECDLYFTRNGERINPIDASGGGTVDVASFALRIASWSMQNPKSRNTIILDEPLKFLSADMQEKASQMLKEISTKLGIQFIIVTHESTLTPFADKIFETRIRKGITTIKST